MESEPERGLIATSRMRLGFVLAGAIIVLSMAGATVGVGMVQVNKVATTLRDFGHTENFRQGTITAPPAGKPQTLLLVGSDRRYGDAKGDARSDTLMLIRLDPKQNATTVLSIPRDLRVTIPGHGVDKINSAYGLGGLDLTTRTVKALLGAPGKRFRVNHAIAVDFKGFREAVDILRCIYIDVDRRYYHSNLGLPVSQHYAEIDVQPGYQKLCGQKALDYVRFRHLDNDIVRADRQQGFLRQASAQVSTSSLLSNLHPLVKAFAKSTSTDENLQTSRGILRLLRLAASSAGQPVRQVGFPHTFVHTEPAANPPTAQGPLGAPAAPIGLGDYVTATPEEIQTAVRRFMHPRAVRRPKPAAPVKPKKRSGKKRARVSAASYNLVPALSQAKEIVRPALKQRFKLPFYAPAWLTPDGRYPQSTGVAPAPRLYSLRDRGGKRHQAYRLVVLENEIEGQYYGVQGTTWRNPPVLGGAHSTQRMAGRSYRVYSDGRKIRLVAWHTPRGVYWVSNSLSRDLSNRRMLGIARSLTRIPAR
ncbi:MAG TPA: LCP family protein [Acetobacteraceae bacterium]|nr:LCP family protein [Acetobacteraceae bacterium]